MDRRLGCAPDNTPSESIKSRHRHFQMQMRRLRIRHLAWALVPGILVVYFLLPGSRLEQEDAPSTASAATGISTPASPPTPAVVAEAADPRHLAIAAQWNEALRRGKRESMAQAVQRAAASKSARDIVAARISLAHCFAFLTIHHTRREAMAQPDRDTLNQRCDPQESLVQLRAQLKYAAGWLAAGSDDLLISRVGQMLTREEHVRALELARRSASSELLAWVGHNILDISVYESSGYIAPTDKAERMLDQAIFPLAWDIWGCTQDGSCKAAAPLNNNCLYIGLCTDDLADWPAKFLLEDRKQDSAAILFRNMGLSREQIEQRWRTVQNAVASIGRGAVAN